MPGVRNTFDNTVQNVETSTMTATRILLPEKPFYIYDAIRPAQERLTYAAVISLTDRNGLGKKSGFIPVRFPPAAS